MSADSPVAALRALRMAAWEASRARRILFSVSWTYPTSPSCMRASRRRMALEPQKKAAFQPSLPCWIGP